MNWLKEMFGGELRPGFPDGKMIDGEYGSESPPKSIRSMPDHDFDLGGRRMMRWVEDAPVWVEASADDLDVITSAASDMDDRAHYPVIDLDVPVRLIPSSTPGHGHLYIDKAVPEYQYWGLIDALVQAGLVEPGYLDASETRGFTAVRPPWHRKCQDGEVDAYER